MSPHTGHIQLSTLIEQNMLGSGFQHCSRGSFVSWKANLKGDCQRSVTVIVHSCFCFLAMCKRLCRQNCWTAFFCEYLFTTMLFAKSLCENQDHHNKFLLVYWSKRGENGAKTNHGSDWSVGRRGQFQLIYSNNGAVTFLRLVSLIGLPETRLLTVHNQETFASPQTIFPRRGCSG